MGVRIGRTPSKGKRRGCWVRSSLAVSGVVVLALSLAGCPGGDKPSPPDKRQQEATAYRQCVGTNRTKTAQDYCQLHVWGQTFGESDSRWLCDRMGNWTCGPSEEKL